MLAMYNWYLEVLSNQIHDLGFSLKVKLQLDLSCELIHSRDQVKLQLGFGQESGGNSHIGKILCAQTQPS